MAMLNDISTDLDDVPRFVHAPKLSGNRGRDLAFPVSTAGAVAAAYPDLAPLDLPCSPGDAYARARRVARGTPRWTITYEDVEAFTFEGVAVTRLCRFRDDFVVRVRPGREGGAVIDMRSKSRIGKSDLGTNAKRIRRFLSAVEQIGPSGEEESFPAPGE
ncbi:MAG: DUF1499 domain-containing protein [Candidatus Hydrogenedentes bacterium]|nr:DUF1499 domain-containing protein [Candidatus Hydrogenedentota bacterium]